jgi:PAS domain S-box-containing protein
MSSIESAARPPLAGPALHRAVALAGQIFDAPATVLSCSCGEWSRLEGLGPIIPALASELITCAALVEPAELVIIPDAQEDPRFADAVPLPSDEPKLRFFAMARLRGPAGADPIRYLCVLDLRSRQLRADEKRLLADLAGVVSDQLELPGAILVEEATGRTADIVELTPHRDRDLSAPNGAHGGLTLSDGESQIAKLEARIHELEECNAGLAAGLRGVPTGSSDNELDRARLEQLIEESSDFVGLATLDGKTYYLNKAGQRLIGLERLEEVKRTRIIDYLMREDRSFFLGTVVPSLMRNGTWEGDFRFRNFKTGAAIEVSWNLFLIRNAAGEPVGIATVTRDITERKKAEVALRESEERFRHLVEQAGEAFFVYDLSGRLIDVNREACESLGYKRADLLSLSVVDIEVDVDLAGLQDRWKQLVPGVAVTTTSMHRRQDGTTLPVESRIAVFRSGGQRLILKLVRDITDRKRAEETLQIAHEQLEVRVVERTTELARANDELRAALRENSRLAAAIDSCQLGVLINDPTQPDMPTIFANPAFTQVTGYARSDIMGHNCRFLQGPETDPAAVAEIRLAIKHRRPYRGTLRNYRKDGTPFWNQLSINPVFDESGKLINYVGLQADVTAQVEAQEALRRSEVRFSRMTANVPGMVYQLALHADGTADFPYVSEGCRELLGLEPAEMRPDACTLLDLIHSEDIEDFLHSLHQSKETGTAWSWEGRYRTKAGELRWLQGAARPERLPAGDTMWDGLLLDITTRKRAEQEIQHRARQSAAVAELGQRALASTDHAALTRAVTELVTRTLGLEMCAVSELRDDGGRRVTAAHGFDPDISGEILPLGEGSLTDYVMQHEGPLVVEDLRTDMRFPLSRAMLRQKAVSCLCVVIKGRERALGALLVASLQAHSFGAEDLSFMQGIANVLATAMDRARDEQALRQSEARNAAILETALDCIITLDHEGRIVDFNGAAEKTFGYSRTAALGRPFLELVPTVTGEVAASLRDFARQPAAQDAPLLGQRIEIPARHANGTQIQAELAITRIPVEGLPLFTAYLRDVTERRRTDERLRLLESAVVNAKDAVLIAESYSLDGSGQRVLYANRAFERMTGYSAAEITAQTPRILQGPRTDRAVLDQVRAALKEWKPAQVELINYRKDGSEFWVELSIVPVSDAAGTFTHWVSVQRDITERKRTEAALNQAKEEAEKANAAKSEFLSRMSHELRTPLNAILGFGQLLQMQKLPTAQNDRIGHIVSAGRHLLDLINEVLDIARIEAGRVELSLEPVHVADTVSETLHLIRPLAAQKGITINPGPETNDLQQEHVMADRQRFKQVLLNLLSNAVKYNRPHGTVSLTYREVGDRRLRIEVTDTGEGIAADKFARLFVAFDRLGAEQSDVQGTGLGLALSKRLTEAMNGAIGVESVPGGGATFWIELPRARSQLEQYAPWTRRERTPAEMEALSAAHTVLYIEDNLSNLTLIEHLLADHPEIKLITAMQGRIGLDLARQHHPDLILLDLHLPDLPGWEVLGLLQADEITSSIPVVAVSADATPRQIERLLKAGARAYLTKPLEVDRFHAVLREILEPKAV